MSDDAYAQFQCANEFWEEYHMNVFRADGGNLLLAVTRSGSFILMFALNYYNRTLLSRKAANNINVVRGLILPSYLPYIYCYCALNLAGALIASILNANFTNPSKANSWIIPIEIGFAHWLSEGLAFFLMGYGAGVRAIQRSLTVAGVWGLFTIVYYFILLSLLTDRFDIANGTTGYGRQRLFILFFSYICALLVFYLWFSIAPSKIFYFRPALRFYARFYFCSYLLNLVIGVCLYERVFDVVCPASVLIYIFAAFLQPLAIFRTLQYDSQYWQGLRPNDGNPVAEAFDHLGLDTADSMAENLANFAQGNVALPIIHFGHLKIKNDYVAGGFSRVYFGTCKGKEVAFKIVYAMELAPSDVQEFYREATILFKLQHECVVKCMGICVMPPALTLVLELCEFGALFDFLYKPCREVYKSSRIASVSLGKSLLLGDSAVARALQDAHNVSGSGSIRTSIGNSANIRPSSVRTVSSGLKSSIDRPSSTRTVSSIIDGGNSSIHRASDEPTRKSGSGDSPPMIKSALKKSSFADKVEYKNDVVSNPLTAIPDIEEGELVESKRNFLDSGTVKESFCIETADITTSENKRSSRNDSAVVTRLSFFNRLSERKSRVSIGNHNSPRRSSLPSESDVSSNDGESKAPRQSMAARFMDNMRASMGLAFPTGRSSNLPVESILKPHIFFVSDFKRLKMMTDCASAIAFLHSKGYMHCDIKSLNFLVTSDFKVKLADMGEAMLINSPPKRDRPPIPARNWAPPEVLPSNAVPESYTIESDVYGLCMVLYELVNSQLPFGDLPNEMTQYKWHAILTDKEKRPNLELSEHFFLPDRLRLLIEQGWSVNPHDRPTAQDIYEALAATVTDRSDDNEDVEAPSSS